MPALDPPEVQMDPNMVAQYEQEILVSSFFFYFYLGLFFF